MRLKNIKGSREKIALSQFVIQQPESKRGNWNALFGNKNPIHLEIGMGKGKFIIQLAQLNPTINYIGIERYSSVLIRAIEKQEEIGLSNLVFLCVDAEQVVDLFQDAEIDQIYLNFSDPWPKARHAKRRLTSKEFFGRYDKILKTDGKVIFKTDNRILFDFSLEQVEEAGWKLKNQTFDLHHSEYKEGNIMTEYEEKFLLEGKPIHRLTAYRLK